MAKHRRFADRAGFTCHCWECTNSKAWKNEEGKCGVYGIPVSKYDSPNNICSIGRICNSYTMKGK